MPPLKSLRTRLSSGLAGNIQTVALMKDVARESAANPDIRAAAVMILNTAGIESHDYEGEALAIGQYVQQRVAYLKDPTEIEMLIDPYTLLDQADHDMGRGDCDDMSLLIATLLLAIGHTPVFRCVRYGALYGAYNHIYVIDYITDGQGKDIRLVIDAIIKNRPIGYEVKSTSGDDMPIL